MEPKTKKSGWIILACIIFLFSLLITDVRGVLPLTNSGYPIYYVGLLADAVFFAVLLLPLDWEKLSLAFYAQAVWLLLVLFSGRYTEERIWITIPFCLFAILTVCKQKDGAPWAKNSGGFRRLSGASPPSGGSSIPGRRRPCPPSPAV